MADKLKGRCLCGTVNYECAEKPLSSFFCHCRQCQLAHAAPFCAEAAMPGGSIKITSGSLKKITTAIESGALVDRYFCPECGTHIYAQAQSYPDATMLKVATLNDPELIKPEIHVFTESQLSWSKLDENACKFEQMPSK